MFQDSYSQMINTYCSSSVDKPEMCQFFLLRIFKVHAHFYGPRRTKVGFENILQAFSSRNVDFQSFTTSLNTR